MRIVIDIDENVFVRLFDNGTEDYEIVNDDLSATAKAIRGGTPLPKGYWIKHNTPNWAYYDCSLCSCVATCTETTDSYLWKLSNFCPDCGAKMGNDRKRMVEVKKDDF